MYTRRKQYKHPIIKWGGYDLSVRHRIALLGEASACDSLCDKSSNSLPTVHPLFIASSVHLMRVRPGERPQSLTGDLLAGDREVGEVRQPSQRGQPRVRDPVFGVEAEHRQLLHGADVLHSRVGQLRRAHQRERRE